MTGPLTALRVIEFSGIGPGPLVGQLLADLGADVITIDRASATRPDPTDINRRGKRSIALNLKSAGGVAAAKALIDTADILVEGFRPGVMERMGLGPDDLHARLIYGRMTGWGQDGPLSHSAGHDITYLGITGALHAMGKAGEPPMPPLNLAADFGGGSMFLIFGLLAAVIERERSGRGQVVDAAMIEGVPAMMGIIHAQMAKGLWTHQRESNLLDGGMPFYRSYKTADDKFVAVGPLEPQFFAEFLETLGMPAAYAAVQHDPARHAEMHDAFADAFAAKTRDEWAAIFEGGDACVGPILTVDEARTHPQNAARGVFFDSDGVVQAAPAPRFSRTPAPAPRAPGALGADAGAVLAEAGFSADDIAQMQADGIIT